MARPRSHLMDILREQSLAQKITSAPLEDLGLADNTRFPFLSLVGQTEMKLALLLSLVNRHIGGVLLIGPRGTGKTTAVRGLAELMPLVKHSHCTFGCTEAAVENLGIDAICTDCAQKYAAGEPLTFDEPMRLIELPLNSRLEDVVGGINERVAIEQQKVQLQRGILSYADQNMLYIDEVNLLDDTIINAILDAAAQGMFTVRRGPMSATYQSRLFLVGSMNPEEGKLRPQIQDRFGLRVVVTGLADTTERLEAYRRAAAYHQNRHNYSASWQEETAQAATDIENARTRLANVTFADGVEETGLRWVQELHIQSHRAEIAMFEAARALAALDERDTATLDDLRTVAPMALRHRESSFIGKYIATEGDSDRLLQTVIDS